MTDTEKPQAPTLETADGKTMVDRVKLAHAVRQSVSNIYHERGFDQLRALDLVWVIVDQLIHMVAHSQQVPIAVASEMVWNHMRQANLDIDRWYALQVVAANAEADKPAKPPEEPTV